MYIHIEFNMYNIVLDCLFWCACIQRLTFFFLQVLMRALRDFNTPKIITEDVTIFMGLIGDLFPALDVPRKREMDFEAMVKQSVLVSDSDLCTVYSGTS